MNNAVLITGAAGGIGASLIEVFERTHRVISIDLEPIDRAGHIVFDIAGLEREEVRSELRKQIDSELTKFDARLCALVNNAAVQLLGSTREVRAQDFKATMSVNVSAPLFLSQLILDDLVSSGRGAIVNISSIHASLTKPGFVSYATSKAALSGLTRAMAVDLEGEVRVNCIEPGAIATPMLLAGFAEDESALQTLGSFHPSGRIGEPTEVAELALFLTSEQALFLNGSCISVDGAIRSRLHDPF